MTVVMYCIKISRAFPKDTVTRHWVGLRVRKERVCQLEKRLRLSRLLVRISSPDVEQVGAIVILSVMFGSLCFVSMWLGCWECRLCTCVACKVTGTSPDLYQILFIRTLYCISSLLCCLLVLHIGSIEMGISRKRPATKNNDTDFSDSRNILPLQSSLGASRLGQEVAHPEHDLKW